VKLNGRSENRGTTLIPSLPEAYRSYFSMTQTPEDQILISQISIDEE